MGSLLKQWNMGAHSQTLELVNHSQSQCSLVFLAMPPQPVTEVSLSYSRTEKSATTSSWTFYTLTLLVLLYSLWNMPLLILPTVIPCGEFSVSYSRWYRWFASIVWVFFYIYIYIIFITTFVLHSRWLYKFSSLFDLYYAKWKFVQECIVLFFFF